MNNEILLRVFKKVSLMGLHDCEFEYGDGDESDKEGWTSVEEGKWDGNIFWMMNNDGSMSPLNPQLSALIEAGIVPTSALPDRQESEADRLCPDCNGNGFQDNAFQKDHPNYEEWDCDTCDATGYLHKHQPKTISVTVDDLVKLWEAAIFWFDNSGGPADSFVIDLKTYLQTKFGITDIK